MTASHSASVMLTSMRSRRMPALLISTSSLPKASTAVATSFSAPAQSLMSSVLATASPAGGRDLVDHLLRRAGVAARAVHRAAEVVDHDPGALRGQQEGVLAADAAAGAGHDGHSSVTDAHGRVSPLVGQLSALPRDCRVRVCRPLAGGSVGRERSSATLEAVIDVHQCPYCELRFVSRNEVEDHVALEHRHGVDDDDTLPADRGPEP